MAVFATIRGGSKPPSPPIVVQERIRVTKFDAPSTGGMTIAWKADDDRIIIGEDEFVVMVSDRQIPSRTGWSDWRELGRSMTEEFHTDGFWRNRDVRIKITVDKGALLK